MCKFIYKCRFVFAVVFRTDLQQPEFDIGMQEQRRVRDQQEEQDVVQGVQATQMSLGRHVQERVAVRPPVQLV